ncbi:MAG: DNA polymerase Y family protein [Acidimicrobiales bacterium]|nr:DNA polymerase Y family protein [Acidimicrobiales bacterium]
MAVRSMVVWCRDWAVLAAGFGPDVPVAVLHANRVVACSPASRREGVTRGQRRREAQGRCPALEVVERDEGREARAFEAVVQVVEAFTPRVELTRPGAVTFPTRGPARYFGGDHELAEAIRVRVDEVLAPLDWAGACRVGVADGPFAAQQAALRSPGSVTVVAPGTSAAFLAPLSVAALDRPELVDVLTRLGMRTLGELAALPAADVTARFGREGQVAHRLAAGLDERPPATVAPPPDLHVDLDLDPPADRVEAVAFAARALAEDLFDRLADHGLSCTRVAVAAETERGEVLERLWRHEGVLSAGAVADRVRWQIDGWLHGSAAVRPTTGVVRLRLTPDEVVPARGRQLGFWGEETAAAERAARALARVEGLLGAEAVLVPEVRGGRGPAEQVMLVPASAVDLTATRSARSGPVPPWPGRLPPPWPAVVPAEPVPVEVIDADGRVLRVTGRALLDGVPVAVQIGAHRPLESSPLPTTDVRRIRAWAGPWPVQERWWDPHTSRRRARVQVVLDDGTAHLLCVEGGRWWLEATYD